MTSHDPLAGAGLFQRPAAAVDLLRHAGSIVFLAGELGLDQVNVKLVAADRIRMFKGALGFLGQIKNIAGAKAHHVNNILGPVHVPFVHLKFVPVRHAATSNPGQRAAQPAQRSRRCGQICEKPAARLQPAPQPARRRYPRR